MDSKRLAIVGSGLSGLAALVSLTKAGYKVDLFEKSRLLGGKTTSFKVGDLEIDNGQHVFIGCFTEFRRFVEETGLASALYMQKTFSVTIYDSAGKKSILRALPNLPSPFHTAFSFLMYKHLPVKDKLAVLYGLASLLRKTNTDSKSTYEWLTQHHQTKKSIDAFWQLFLVPALNAELSVVPFELASFTIRESFLGKPSNLPIGFPIVPLGHIAKAAAAKAEHIFTRYPVVGVEPNGSSGVIIRTMDGKSHHYNAVVIAVGPYDLGKIIDVNCILASNSSLEFITRPIIDVHLLYDAPSVGIGFAGIIGSPVQWVFEKPNGHLCCSMSAAHNYVRMHNVELINLCREWVEKLNPQLKEIKFIKGIVTRDLRATFLPRSPSTVPPQSTLVPNIAIAGAWTRTGWPPTMESAVRSGRKAAEVLLNAL